jgi:DNA-binding CsgD family transcriptional regulator/tetratricopeptide (TPR) repeat protein
VVETRPLVSPVLVGRDDMLDLADRRIAEVAEGHGRFLLLAGEAGVGKTRLLAAIAERSTAAGFSTCRGGAYPSDIQVAAAVLIDLARQMRRSPPAGDLGTRLETRLDAGAEGAGDAHRRRRLLVLDAAELLASSADPGPTVIALEDLHWSDDLTLEILESLTRRLPEIPLLVIVTYRSDELYPRVPMREWRARLVTRRLAEEIRLRRLTADETATMTTVLSGNNLPVARDVAAAVHLRSDGIPLHIEELLGGLTTAPTGPEAVRAADVPDTLEAAVTARLERRTGPAVDVARAGAVIGRSFDVDLLADVMASTPDLLVDPLVELDEHFLLSPSAASGRYSFRHALICDAIYARIPAPVRRRLHERVAEAAATRSDVGTSGFLALHFERAGRPRDAFQHALAGALQAASLSSHGEARDLYAIALRTAPADLPPDERGRVLEAYAAQAAATDANDVAAEAYESARAAYLEAGDAVAAAAVVGPQVAIRHLLGEALDDRAARLRQAMAELPVGPSLHSPPADVASGRVRASLLAELAAAFMLDRRLDESIAYATEAGRLAAAVGDEAVERHAMTTLGACEVFAGSMSAGWSRLEDAVERSRSAKLEAEAARAYRMIATSASVLVEYDRAERWLRDGIDYADRVELWNHRHYMAAHLGHVLWATGRWPDADTIARHALADGRGGVTTRITALHVLGYLALGRGQLGDADTALSEARELGWRMRELQRLSPALWGLSELAVVRGDWADAIVLAEEGLAASLRVADAAYLYPFAVTGTRAFLGIGDPAGARGWIDRVRTMLELRALPGTLPAVDHALGLVALADGRTGQARTALASAMSAWGARGRVWEGTWALIDLARAHARANQPADAGREAAAAQAVADRIGSPVLRDAASAADIMPAARGSAAGTEPWSPLTAREFEVARLVAEGGTNGEIAGRLGVATRTVSAHVEHILAKLDVNRRTEIAAWVAARAVLHSRPHGENREE